jgi:hypothetical protein
MELLVLNTNLESVAILDTFDSLLWVERYSSCGDFEIYTTVNAEDITVLQPDYYLWSSDSEMVMIIEDRRITTDVEDGNKFIVTGKSLEYILHRRIICQTILTGNLQDEYNNSLT